jgi:hypothetical protein
MRDVLVTAQLTQAVMDIIDRECEGHYEHVWIVASSFNAANTINCSYTTELRRQRILFAAHKLFVNDTPHMVRAIHKAVLSKQQKKNSFYMPTTYEHNDHIRRNYTQSLWQLRDLMATISGQEETKASILSFADRLWAKYNELIDRVPATTNDMQWNHTLVDEMKLPADFIDHLQTPDGTMRMMGATPEFIDHVGIDTIKSWHRCLTYWVLVFQPFGNEYPMDEVTAVFMWQNGIRPSDDIKQTAEEIQRADQRGEPDVEWDVAIVDCEVSDTNALELVRQRQRHGYNPLRKLVLQLPYGDSAREERLRHKIVSRMSRYPGLTEFVAMADPHSRNAGTLIEQWGV